MTISEARERYPLSYFFMRENGMTSAEILKALKQAEKLARKHQRKNQHSRGIL